jgi:hypothetical protein
VCQCRELAAQVYKQFPSLLPPSLLVPTATGEAQETEPSHLEEPSHIKVTLVDYATLGGVYAKN